MNAHKKPKCPQRLKKEKKLFWGGTQNFLGIRRVEVNKELQGSSFEGDLRGGGEDILWFGSGDHLMSKRKWKKPCQLRA